MNDRVGTIRSLTPAEIEAMTIDARRLSVESILIEHPQFTELLTKMEHCRTFSKIARDLECLLAIGEAGTGKTRAIEHYMKAHPRQMTESGTVIPVLSSVVPVPASYHTLAYQLLVDLGDPVPNGSTAQKTRRLVELMKDCRVELLIIDEVNHLLDKESGRILKTPCDWLKNLMNATNIPVVLFGTPGAGKVIEDNPQLRRRFSMRSRLEPFGFETDEEKINFRKFLYILDTQLPLTEHSGLAGRDLSYRIHYATGGSLASMMKFIRRATHLALDGGAGKIDLDLMEAAFEVIRGGWAEDDHRPKNKENPFKFGVFDEDGTRRLRTHRKERALQ
jgi:hypothetical protein